jgi:TonB family protein
MEPRAGPVGPRKVDLFPAGAIVRAAEPGPAPSKGEPVGKRLGDWSQQFADAERARIGDDTPALRELGRRMGDWLLISGQAGESLRRAAPLGLGPASTLLAAFNAWQQEVETRRAVGRPHEAVPFYANPLMDHGPIESFVALCWGNCTGYFGHRVSYLVVTIEVDHDEAGVPSDWRVWESSGDARFDEAALDAIKDAIAWAPPDVLKSDRPAAYSRWQLSASAHRYHRGETLMDPAFVPPGDEIEKYSDLLGKTTVVKRARLVAVRYRSAPEPAGGPRG